MGVPKSRKPLQLDTMSSKEMADLIKSDIPAWNLAKKRWSNTPNVPRGHPHVLAISGQDFSGHNLRFINLAGVSLPGCSFVNTDLRDATMPLSFVRLPYGDAKLNGMIIPSSHRFRLHKSLFETYEAALQEIRKAGYFTKELSKGRLQLATLEVVSAERATRFGFVPYPQDRFGYGS